MINIEPVVPAADEVMNYKGLAVYLKLSAGTLRHKVMRNEIPYIKIDGAVRFSKKIIDAWLVEKLRKPNKKKVADDAELSADRGVND